MNTSRPGAPLFQEVFSVPWNDLPPVMRTRYGVRPFSTDRVTVEGRLKMRISFAASLLSPFLRFVGAFAPFTGEDAPVSVSFSTGPGTGVFHFDRLFHFPGRKPYRFHSLIEHAGGDEMVEFIRFGFAWRMQCRAEGQRVVLRHRGYLVRIGRQLVRLPLEWLLGRCEAGEEAVGPDSYRMWMTVVHPLFGFMQGYGGTFRVTEESHA